MKTIRAFPCRQRVFRAVTVLAICAASAGSTLAGVSYTAPEQVVSQDFDTLASTGTNVPWTNNDTLPGWYVVNSGGTALTSYRTSSGASTVNVLLSLGNSSDRALGYQGTGSDSIHYGLRLVNNTGVVLNEFSLSYKGEQWREVDTPVDSIVFDYRTFTADGGVLHGSSGWTPVESLRFDSPHTTASAADNAALNGNLPENSALLSGTVSGAYWLPGQELWLRWTDIARNASNTSVYQMMGIDDVQFTTPVPSIREVPVCFDFGRSNLQVPDPTASAHAFGYYNNIISEALGLKTTNAVNIDNVPTGMNLRITNAFDGVTSSGSEGVSSSSGAGFHPSAQQDGFFIRTSGSAVAALRLENLDPTLLYDIDLFGSRTTVPSDRYTVYTIGDVEQVLDTKANTLNVASFLRVAPEYDQLLDDYVINIGVRLLNNTAADAALRLLVNSDPSWETTTDHGYLSAMRVTPVPEPGTLALLLVPAAYLAVRRRRKR